MKTNKFAAAAIAGTALFLTGALGQSSAGGQSPTPNEVIYLPQLPTAASLANSASSQGMTIASIDQRNGEEFVTYHFANGPDSVVAYRLLANAGSATNVVPSPTPAPAVTGPAPTAVAAGTVVYDAAAPSYYYDYDYPVGYYPYWGWYPGGYVGIGWGGGFRGGWGGGFHGGGFHR